MAKTETIEISVRELNRIKEEAYDKGFNDGKGIADEHVDLKAYLKKHTGKSERTFQKWIANGEFPTAEKVGHKWVIRYADIPEKYKSLEQLNNK